MMKMKKMNFNKRIINIEFKELFPQNQVIKKFLSFYNNFLFCGLISKSN